VRIFGRLGPENKKLQSLKVALRKALGQKPDSPPMVNIVAAKLHRLSLPAQIPEEVRILPVQSLDIDRKVLAALQGSEKKTLGEILDLTEDDILKLRGISRDYKENLEGGLIMLLGAWPVPSNNASPSSSHSLITAG
jgi:hypothetical protein